MSALCLVMSYKLEPGALCKQFLAVAVEFKREIMTALNTFLRVFLGLVVNTFEVSPYTYSQLHGISLSTERLRFVSIIKTVPYESADDLNEICKFSYTKWKSQLLCTYSEDVGRGSRRCSRATISA